MPIFKQGSKKSADIARSMRADAAKRARSDRAFMNKRLAALRKNAATMIQRAFRSHLWAPPHGPFYRNLHREVTASGDFQPMHMEPSQRALMERARLRLDPNYKKELALQSLAQSKLAKK